METKKSQTLSHQVAEIKLSYSRKVPASQMVKIDSSRSAHDILFNYWDPDKITFVEQFKILLLNRANKVLGIFEVSTGGVSGTVADPKVIFAAAIKANASSMILAHNHPSGNLMASQSDIDLTKKLIAGGKFLEIQVFDHLIITTEGYTSFADEGLMTV